MTFSVANLFTTLFSAFAVGSTNGLAVAPQQCPRFDVFRFFVSRQCPAFMGADLRCVIGLPGDVTVSGVLNCATVDDAANASLQILEPSEMLALVRYRDPYGRPWCMLSLFYSPNCVFSAKIASTIYQVAPLFPKLKVVAVDVSTFSRNVDSLVAQYGVASTPMVALWENGYTMFRLYDDAKARLDALVRTIRLRTDLTPRRSEEIPVGGVDERNAHVTGGGGGPEPERELNNAPVMGNEARRRQFPSEDEFLRQFRYLNENIGFDWYFSVALVASTINLTYFAVTSALAKRLLDRVRLQFFARPNEAAS